MLFKQWALDGIASGDIVLAFRNWRRPSVKAGTRLRTAIGLVVIDAIDVVEPAQISETDARRAGFSSHDALLQALGARTGAQGDRTVYRIELHLAGPDPREALRERADLSADEVAAIGTRLQRFDAASTHGPWTLATLQLIADRPATRAVELAAETGRPKDKFKTDVRKLKELGLTESLGTGYRLSPRGHAFLARRLG